MIPPCKCPRWPWCSGLGHKRAMQRGSQMPIQMLEELGHEKSYCG